MNVFVGHVFYVPDENQARKKRAPRSAGPPRGAKYRVGWALLARRGRVGGSDPHFILKFKRRRRRWHKGDSLPWARRLGSRLARGPAGKLLCRRLLTPAAATRASPMRKLSVLPLFLLPGLLLGQAVGPVDTTFVNRYEMGIPFSAGPGAQNIKQLQLFVSTDAGRTWVPSSTVAPSVQKIMFR